MLNITRGQVWVETVLYTLIGLSLIAVVLVFATPKINEAKDRIAIEQSIESMQLLGDKIDSVLSSGSGTRAIVPALTIKRGKLFILPSDKTIRLDIDNLNLLFSESGVEIPFGRVNVKSLEGQKYNSVSIILKFNAHLEYAGATDNKTLSSSATPYKISLEKRIDNNEAIVNIQSFS
ncbi:MAG: hypothetical protein AABX07_03630 [Nanoarchaeota archaeon]